jgi:hypothetical protein
MPGGRQNALWLPEDQLGILESFGTLTKPRKMEFIKRLVAKRKEGATDIRGVLFIPSGTAQARLINLGLGSIDFLGTPEATIVNVLEKYWLPHVHGFYSTSLQLSPYPTETERAAAEQKRIESWVGHIEYLITGRPDAATLLPRGLSLLAYIRYRISREHRNNPYVRAEDGFTDNFIEYAIAESKYVFGR